MALSHHCSFQWAVSLPDHELISRLTPLAAILLVGFRAGYLAPSMVTLRLVKRHSLPTLRSPSV